MKNNILILSAGRRVELVQSFQKELANVLPDNVVYCADMNPHLSAACQVADKSFKLPRASDDNYIQAILEVCLEYDIGLVIPTIDTELLVLAMNSSNFSEQGIDVVISSEHLISQCRDKRQTARLFHDMNVEQPAIFEKDTLHFPCFCKPYDGSCSVGAFPIYNKSDLTQEILDNPKNMFMELVPKTYYEYTVDAYYCKSGNLKCLVPRKRLEVRGGEVSKGVTKKDFLYDYLVERFNRFPGARGCITLQFFVNEELQDVKGLEVNPRFGGGYPLAYDAGANFPKWLIQEYLLSEKLSFFSCWEPELTMLRFDSKVLVRESK
jgi:carbamoyl-phosphate synthase large subunit